MVEIFYHGTNYDFDKFSFENFGENDYGYLGYGIYLTNDLEMAESYADGEYGQILECEIDIKNPYVITDFAASKYPEYLRDKLGINSARGITKYLKDKGYDSVLLTYEEDWGDTFKEVCVFDPSKIKIIDKKLKESFEGPKVYYHGSNAKFTQFDKSKIKENKLGLTFNFTDDYGIAYQYGDNIIKAHLDLNNPITSDELCRLLTYEEYLKLETVLTGREAKSTEEEWKKNKFTLGKVFNWYKHLPEFIEYLEDLGYDGLAFPEDNHYGVFEPEQIHIIQEESLNEQLEKVNNDILITKSTYDVLLTLKRAKKELRILYDDLSGYYIIGDAFKYVHYHLLEEAYNQGFYYEFNDLINEMGALENYKDIGRDGYDVEEESYEQLDNRAEDGYVDSWLYYIYFTPQEIFEQQGTHVGVDEYRDAYEYTFGEVSTRECKLEDTPLYNEFKNELCESFTSLNEKLETFLEQIAYHGTNAEFDKFDLNKFQRGDYGYGIYLTRDKGYAGDYGKVGEYEIPEYEELLDNHGSEESQSEYVQECIKNITSDLYHNFGLEIYNQFTDVLYRDYCNTGWWLYKTLWDILGSDKEASKYLDKHGIKGIWDYQGNCIVIFNPDNIKRK